GNMGLLHSSELIKLRLRCDKPVLNHLLEAPLADDQETVDFGDKHFELTATLSDTQDLRWWLTAQASHLDILEPTWLRNEVQSTLEGALQRIAAAGETISVEA